jgi:hypothetical protein
MWFFSEQYSGQPNGRDGQDATRPFALGGPQSLGAAHGAAACPCGASCYCNSQDNSAAWVTFEILNRVTLTSHRPIREDIL